MTFRTTRRADQDIIDLYVYGASQFGSPQAERYHAGLLALFDLLASNPFIARLRTEFSPPVRLHPYRAHLIVYVEDGQGILIVRVLHGRQDWEQVLS